MDGSKYNNWLLRLGLVMVAACIVRKKHPLGMKRAKLHDVWDNDYNISSILVTTVGLVMLMVHA